jgi:hypothetical protein
MARLRRALMPQCRVMKARASRSAAAISSFDISPASSARRSAAALLPFIIEPLVCGDEIHRAMPPAGVHQAHLVVRLGGSLLRKHRAAIHHVHHLTHLTHPEFHCCLSIAGCFSAPFDGMDRAPDFGKFV